MYKLFLYECTFSTTDRVNERLTDVTYTSAIEQSFKYEKTKIIRIAGSCKARRFGS